MILLVIDAQKGIADEELYAYDTFMDRTVRLIEAARKNHVEVVRSIKCAVENNSQTQVNKGKTRVFLLL